MEHHLARDLLEGYVEDSLEPETKSLLEAHLDTCEECRSIVDAAEPPIELRPDLPTPADEWDEKRMRKTIRRTLGRLVFDAISIWIIGAIVLWIVSFLAIQPLLIDRGDRIREAFTATWDLPMLTTPGATIEGWRNDSTLFGRELSVDVGRYLGSRTEDLGTYETDLGIWRFSQSHGAALSPPYFGSESRRFQPDRIPDDTVATVELHWWENPLTISQAEALRPDNAVAWLLWAGFDVSPALPGDAEQYLYDSDRLLGYDTCGQLFEDFDDTYWGAGSSAGSGTSNCHYLGTGSVTEALAQVRRATANLAGSEAIVESLSTPPQAALQSIEAVAAWLADNEPRVGSLVLTGPTENIADIVEASGAEDAVLLDVDFWNWEG